MGYELWMSPHTGYRRRGTSFAELRGLFEKGLTAAAISELLRCCKSGDSAMEVRAELERLDFDVAGVLDPDSGRVIGWVDRATLAQGECSEHCAAFQADQLISESAPLVDVIHVLAKVERVYVIERTRVSGLVTRADLRKPPVRTLLFGLVSLLEMHLTYWIRTLFPNNLWQRNLTDGRLDKARTLFDQRRARNEDISVVDCLQLCDKRDIVSGSDEAIETLGLDSQVVARQQLRAIEGLRDRVAHSQDDVAGDGGWSDVSSIIETIHSILSSSDYALETRANSHNALPPNLIPAI